MSQEPKKILIIEDERPIVRALTLKLSSLGFEVSAAFDGEEALKILETEKFDLIVSDLVMPRLDGFGVMTSLQNDKNQTPVVVLSNLSQQEDEARSKELGAKDFFVKSNVPIAEIVNYIKKILE